MESIVCNLAYYNAALGKMGAVSCKCETSDCCDSGDTLYSSDGGYDTSELSTRSLLQKRAGPRPFNMTFANGQSMHWVSFSVSQSLSISVNGPLLILVSMQHWSRGNVPPNHPIMQLGFTFSDPADCMIPDVEPEPLTVTTRRAFSGTRIPPNVR